MSKRHGSPVIKVRQYADGRWGFDDRWTTGKRIQVRRLTRPGAQDAANDLEVLIVNGRRDLLTLDRGELARFRAWESQFKSGRTLKVMAAEFLALKSQTSQRNYKSVENDLKLLVDYLGETRPVVQITTPEIQSFVNSRPVKARRRFNLRALAVALWAYAYRQGETEGPLTAAERVEKIAKRPGKVNIITPEDLEKLFTLVHPDYLPWLAIGAFAGIRSEEIAPDKDSRKSPLMWEDFKWEKGHIYLRRETAKTGRSKVPQPRLIPIQQNLLTWLANYRTRKGRVCPRQPTKHHTRTLARKMHWSCWPHNCLRDSYASYRIALTNNRSGLAYEMGNSERMIQNSYEEQVDKAEAEKWFSITRAGAENVIQVPQKSRDMASKRAISAAS